MYVFVYGDYDEEWVVLKVLEVFGDEKRESVYNDFFINILFEKIRYVIEEMEVNQGKIVFGIRINVDVIFEDYYKFLMFNGILGIFLKLKFFENVCEKVFLCYYVFLKIDRFKFVMIISFGIEIENYEKVLNLILQQIEDIKNGKIDNIEYESVINYYKIVLMVIYDSLRDFLSFYLNQVLVG